MKILSLLLLTLFLGKGCEAQNNEDIKNTVIEYVANSRGFYQKITIQNQTISVSKDRSGNKQPTVTKITDANWKELFASFKSVELDRLPSLKAPTEKRFYDGAAIAHLKIIYKDKTYETPAFDHGFPPAEIKKIITQIHSFAKQNDEN